jgi:trans-aconitate methyltransferase
MLTHKDTLPEERNIQQMTCSFCKGATGTYHEAREMMFGFRHRFLYWQCHGCEAIHLANPPADLSPYYPENYYSFQPEQANWLKLAFYRAHLRAPGAMSRLRPCRPEVAAITRLKPRRGATVLDVGCGAGYMVDILRRLGFDAMGVDAFIREETEHVRRKTIDEIQGQWDIIVFNYSMEHMPDHPGLLRAVAERLTPEGVCITHIPLVGWAWRHYGINWAHLDPPRHLTIHSRKSFEMVSQQAGLQVTQVVYESTAQTMWVSELYKKNISLAEGGVEMFTKQQMKEFSRRTESHNREQQGDVVLFYLKKK